METETAQIIRKPAAPVRPPVRLMSVMLAGKLTALVSPCASLRQMDALADALPEVGINARLWRPWEERLTAADCLHLFGMAQEFLPVAATAHQHGLKVVLTPQMAFDESAGGQESQPLAQKVTAWAGHLGRSICRRWPSWRRDLCRVADLLLPNSTHEAQQLIRQFQVPAEKIRVVPHGVDPRFAQAEADRFVERYGCRDFALYAGPIEPRNHQLGFLWAMNAEDVPVVILGDAVPGHEWYFEECVRVAGPRVRFLPQFEADDPLRASAFAACGCLAVAGGVEAPELMALEAGVAGTPLVLFEGGCGAEYFGHQAVYVKADDVQGIRRGVLTALARKRSASLAEHVRTYFSWNAVAKVTREAYAKVLREPR